MHAESTLKGCHMVGAAWLWAAAALRRGAGKVLGLAILGRGPEVREG